MHVTSYWLIYFFKVTIFQWIPSLIVDILIVLCGKKAKYKEIYTKILKI